MQTAIYNIGSDFASHDTQCNKTKSLNYISISIAISTAICVAAAYQCGTTAATHKGILNLTFTAIFFVS